MSSFEFKIIRLVRCKVHHRIGRERRRREYAQGTCILHILEIEIMILSNHSHHSVCIHSFSLLKQVKWSCASFLSDGLIDYDYMIPATWMPDPPREGILFFYHLKRRDRLKFCIESDFSIDETMIMFVTGELAITYVTESPEMYLGDVRADLGIFLLLQHF